jgi:hypothetical protein
LKACARDELIQVTRHDRLGGRQRLAAGDRRGRADDIYRVGEARKRHVQCDDRRGVGNDDDVLSGGGESLERGDDAVIAGGQTNEVKPSVAVARHGVDDAPGCVDDFDVHRGERRRLLRRHRAVDRTGVGRLRLRERVLHDDQQRRRPASCGGGHGGCILQQPRADGNFRTRHRPGSRGPSSVVSVAGSCGQDEGPRTKDGPRTRDGLELPTTIIESAIIAVPSLAVPTIPLEALALPPIALEAIAIVAVHPVATHPSPFVAG